MEENVAHVAYLEEWVSISEGFLSRKYSLFTAKDKIRELNAKYASHGFAKKTSPVGDYLARSREYEDIPQSSYGEDGDYRKDEDGDIDGWRPSLC